MLLLTHVPSAHFGLTAEGTLARLAAPSLKPAWLSVLLPERSGRFAFQLGAQEANDEELAMFVVRARKRLNAVACDQLAVAKAVRIRRPGLSTSLMRAGFQLHWPARFSSETTAATKALHRYLDYWCSELLSLREAAPRLDELERVIEEFGLHLPTATPAPSCWDSALGALPQPAQAGALARTLPEPPRWLSAREVVQRIAAARRADEGTACSAPPPVRRPSSPAATLDVDSRLQALRNASEGLGDWGVDLREVMELLEWQMHDAQASHEHLWRLGYLVNHAQFARLVEVSPAAVAGPSSTLPARLDAALADNLHALHLLRRATQLYCAHPVWHLRRAAWQDEYVRASASQVAPVSESTVCEARLYVVSVQLQGLAGRQLMAMPAPRALDAALHRSFPGAWLYAEHRFAPVAAAVGYAPLLLRRVATLFERGYTNSSTPTKVKVLQHNACGEQQQLLQCLVTHRAPERRGSAAQQPPLTLTALSAEDLSRVARLLSQHVMEWLAEHGVPARLLSATAQPLDAPAADVAVNAPMVGVS